MPASKEKETPCNSVIACKFKFKDRRVYLRNRCVHVEACDLAEEKEKTLTRSKSVPSIPVSWRFTDCGERVPIDDLEEDPDHLNSNNRSCKGCLQSLKSIGSLGHSTGNCHAKRCYWHSNSKKGCQRGWLCDHCHFCPPAPKDDPCQSMRRECQLAKKRQQQQMMAHQQQQQQQPRGFIPSEERERRMSSDSIKVLPRPTGGYGQGHGYPPAHHGQRGCQKHTHGRRDRAYSDRFLHSSSPYSEKGSGSAVPTPAPTPTSSRSTHARHGPALQMRNFSGGWPTVAVPVIGGHTGGYGYGYAPPLGLGVHGAGGHQHEVSTHEGTSADLTTRSPGLSPSPGPA
uniref:Uncharacterized protein n=1 Tax=Chromera velia CCMP2878 TaxID=1169474 RepID=A0A0G4GAS7_9ALVE|eukprot:Cvel_4421.t1-p1 / transcript=Cvel_4421.t1 / gene=Cvel_4421 / organism=Chromera_velia_CCMP2878 / gene_product=hypothetical protein / transcript_product=hypothetical protein / location=Cvel_scaffold192:71816-72838(+) / protein_length=341 / sequence_SO=supercontig / SO=protein_coding / is_pseudo=false